MVDVITIIIILLVVALVGVGALIFIFSALIEPTYILLFNKPLYVHLYPIKKKLTSSQEFILKQNFPFYSRLSDRRKKYFRHRVASFINRYGFVGRDGLTVTEEMKVKIAGTAVMLTFGMRGYLPNIFSVVVVYPDVFMSVSGDYHKGEFNALAGAVVFSWKHFEEGLLYSNDNLNLGLHEFAHVLHVDAMRRRRVGTSSVIFNDAFTKVVDYANDSRNKQKLVDAGYFREYAFTNKYEFIAVLLEHFFETPQEFSRQFPELYKHVKVMINYKV